MQEKGQQTERTSVWFQEKSHLDEKIEFVPKGVYEPNATPRQTSPPRPGNEFFIASLRNTGQVIKHVGKHGQKHLPPSVIPNPGKPSLYGITGTARL